VRAAGGQSTLTRRPPLFAHPNTRPPPGGSRPSRRRSLVTLSSGGTNFVPLAQDQEGGSGEEQGQPCAAEPSDERVAPVEPAGLGLGLGGDQDVGGPIVRRKHAAVGLLAGLVSRAGPIRTVVRMGRGRNLGRSEGARAAGSSAIVRPDDRTLHLGCPGAMDAVEVVRVSRRRGLSRGDRARPARARLVVRPRLRDRNQKCRADGDRPDELRPNCHVVSFFRDRPLRSHGRRIGGRAKDGPKTG
jgi:hypothetical protein